MTMFTMENERILKSQQPIKEYRLLEEEWKNRIGSNQTPFLGCWSQLNGQNSLLWGTLWFQKIWDLSSYLRLFYKIQKVTVLPNGGRYVTTLEWNLFLSNIK